MEILSIIAVCIVTAMVTYFFVAYTVWWFCGVVGFWENQFRKIFSRKENLR